MSINGINMSKHPQTIKYRKTLNFVTMGTIGIMQGITIVHTISNYRPCQCDIIILVYHIDSDIELFK